MRSDPSDRRHMRSEFRKEAPLFDQALRLRDEEKYEQAVEILKGFTERYPEVAASFGILGGIYYEIGEYEEAIYYLSHATRINPRSELASRGLMHSFLDSGRTSEAITELERYIGLTDSEEFKGILQEVLDNEALFKSKKHLKDESDCP